MSKKAVIIAIGSYCGIFLLLFIFQSALVFPKGGRPFGDCEEWDAIEGTYQSVSYEEENIKFLQKGANTNLPSLLIFHGNSKTACSRTWLVEGLSKLDVNFFSFEYPGYGGDSRKTTENSILGSAVLFSNYLKSLGFKKQYFLGESLGTGVATFLASRLDTMGLILLSPFTSIPEAGQFRFWMFPILKLIKVQMPSKIWARSVKAPTLILHGKIDPVISYEMGKALSRSFSSNVQFVTFEKAGHTNFQMVAKEKLFNSIFNFIEETR